MQHQIFSIPVFGATDSNDEMNRFIRSKKVVKIEKYFVQNPAGDYWTFCIQFTDGQSKSENFDKKTKTDWVKELEPEKSKLFVAFRKYRLELSKEHGIPAYSVFDDDELASIAQLNEINEKNIKALKNITPVKAEKFAKIICEMHQKATDEAIW